MRTYLCGINMSASSHVLPPVGGLGGFHFCVERHQIFNVVFFLQNWCHAGWLPARLNMSAARNSVHDGIICNMVGEW
jgi:hypothetical protein